MTGKLPMKRKPSERFKLNLIFKVFKKGELTKRMETGSKRRFFYHARLINWENSKNFKVSLKVIYGHFKDNFNHLTQFSNEAGFRNKKTFWKTLETFLDKKLLDELKKEK